MADEYKVSAATLGADSVIDDDDNVNIAFLRLGVTADSFNVSFHWLPLVFRHPMPKPLRDEIVKRLRLHADKLESGETDKAMQRFLNINETPGHA